jgi:hypothetical protein
MKLDTKSTATVFATFRIKSAVAAPANINILNQMKKMLSL